MKLFSDAWAKDASILFWSIDCRVCGKMFAEHLIWPEAEPERAGLCDEHFAAMAEYLGSMEKPQ